MHHLLGHIVLCEYMEVSSLVLYSNYLSISFEGQTAETFAETKPAPTLLPYPTLQKQLNQLTGQSTIRFQSFTTAIVTCNKQ